MRQRPTKLMVISSTVLAVAPKCPVCLMAYFGVFGVATASAAAYRLWLPPLTALWLVLTVGVLALRGGSQRRYGPALLALFAGLAVFGGKFIFNYQTLVYAGIAALVCSAVWHAWPRKAASSQLCTQCESPPRDKETGTRRDAALTIQGIQYREGRNRDDGRHGTNYTL
jgi:hypothetical protein